MTHPRLAFGLVAVAGLWTAGISADPLVIPEFSGGMSVGLLPAVTSLGGPSPATHPCPAPLAAVMGDTDSPDWVGALLLDPDGDGVLELFLADRGRGGNAGELWTLFRVGEGGEYRAVDTVFFHPLGFRLEESRLETYWRSNVATGRFITYRIGPTSIEEVERTEVIEVGDPEFERRWAAIREFRSNLAGQHWVARWQEIGEGDRRLECRAVE